MTHHEGAAPSRVFYGWWVAAAFSLIILLSTGARFAVGPFLKPVVSDLGLDRGSVSLVISVAFSLLFLARDPAALAAVAAIGGLGMAGSLAMTSALSADIFGQFSVGSIFGLIFMIHQMGAALGAWLAGFLFDLSAGYGLAFGVSCALLLVGAGLSLTIDVAARPPVRRELQPVAGGM